ncbi:uncharacterized protein traf3ip2a [Brachyhypopomus gauderio]|uniref:uncharacterized protein traf3ip2a n=1 Tax=Brachyhypopomus gauderio TaxID=698409 RepID=UPI0040421471
MSCPHLSVPVETDESMTSSSLNLAWPVCQQCSAHSHNVREDGRARGVTVKDVEEEYPQNYLRSSTTGSKGTGPVSFSFKPPGGLRSHPSRRPIDPASHPWLPLEDNLCKDLSYMFHRDHYSDHAPPQWNPPSEVEEGFELPLSLRSDVNEAVCRHAPGPSRCPVNTQALDAGHRQCPRPCLCQHPPVSQIWHNYPQPPQHTPIYQQNTQARRLLPTPVVPMAAPQCPAPAGELMKVCHLPTQPIGASQAPFQEMKRTISLPDNCRTVFITYSVDTATEMIPFVKFLIHHGFRPAIDIFDHAIQQMDMNKWMDSYLKDKSVLIIVAISPKYKIDVEGDGSDQHGLHTKYIHSQIQNEFIQQRCLNFRLVPVLFPNANQSDVPLWLRSTRLFLWPLDAQDLLLRLLREERYIPPPLGKELTLVIKPL